jgi:subfamily B ATP-binding cassette protein HlyB/CyaB
MLRLVGVWQEFQQASVGVRRLGDVMDMPTEPFTVLPSRSRRTAGHVTVKGLGFRYSEQHPSAPCSSTCSPVRQAFREAAHER